MLNYQIISDKVVSCLLITFIFLFPIYPIYKSTNYVTFIDFILFIYIIKIIFIDKDITLLSYFKNKLFSTIILFSSFLLLSFIWSNEHPLCFYGNSKHYIHIFLYFFIFPFLIFSLVSKKIDISILITSFLFAMFINELISYSVHFGLWTTEFGTKFDPIPLHMHHITYSTYAGLAVLLSVYRFIYIELFYKKTIYLIFLTSLTINLFLSAGRTGQFSLFLTSIILILIYFKGSIKKILLMFFTLLILFFTAYITLDTFHKRVNRAIYDTTSALNATNLDTSFGTRIAAFKALPYLLEKENFLFGVGVGDKPTYVKEKLEKDFPYQILAFNKYGYLHNSHIEIFISLGFFGLLLYFLIFYFTFTIKIEDKMIKYIAHTIAIYFIFIGLTTDLFYFYHITVLFASFLGIVVAQNYHESKKKCP